jgi:hypothetical protein
MRSYSTIGTEAPVELVRLARERLGEQHAPVAHLVRLALAQLVDVNVEDFTPKRGRPRKAGSSARAAQTKGKTVPE